jgi:hypothetical protein
LLPQKQQQDLATRFCQPLSTLQHFGSSVFAIAIPIIAGICDAGIPGSSWSGKYSRLKNGKPNSIFKPYCTAGLF